MMFWKHAETFLRKATTPEALQDAEMRCKTGAAHLWPTKRAAVVCEPIRDYRVWLAGGDLDEIIALLPVAERWAKAAGYDRIVIHMDDTRKGWKRLMKRHGFSQETMLVKEL